MTGIYIRVSTDEQAEHGFSIRAQEEKLRYYAQIKEWPIYRVYIDEGKSGKNIYRPALQLLLQDIKNGIIKNVLVFKIDRLTRSTKDLIELIDYFQKYNCDFNSLTELIDTSSPTGRMFIKIIGLFAEFERETIVERIKVGCERKVKEGYSLCSSTPSYGYYKEKGNNIQQVDCHESPIVQKIFNDFNNGISLESIKKSLNSLQIKTKKGHNWTIKALKNVLTNPNYIGYVRYGLKTNKYFECPGRHQPLISFDMYQKTQLLLQKKLRTKPDAFFSNKLICLCHHPLITKRVYNNEKCYINYRCPNKECHFKSISHKCLEQKLNISNWKFNTKFNYVQTNISMIIIKNVKKDFEVVYINVNEEG